MRVKIQPKDSHGETLYVSLPYVVEQEFNELLCTGRYELYADYLTPIVNWLQAEYGVGAFERWYDSDYAPGETFLSFSGGQSVVLY